MRIKSSVDLSVLLKYGFSLAEDAVSENDDDYSLITNHLYILWIGHSRRGQHYCLLVGEDRIVNIYGSTPDGYGGVCALPNVLVKMCIEGLIE